MGSVDQPIGTATKLKHCPFCGSRAIPQHGDMDQWRVICINNECNAMVYAHYADSMDRAIERWNRRVKE